MRGLFLYLALGCFCFGQPAPAPIDKKAMLKHIVTLARQQQAQLTAETAEVNQLDQEIAAVQLSLALADKDKDQIASEAAQLQADYAKVSTAYQKSEAALIVQTKLAWKWRLISLGLVIAAGLWVWISHQFPFLKLL